MLRQKLRGSKYGDDECIRDILAAFERRVCSFFL